MKIWLRTTTPCLCIALVLFIFFIPLMWPSPQIIITPDFVRSDALHSSFSLKYILSQSLRHGTIPLWSPYIGTGFPTIGEGQIGTFFPVNLLLFRLLPPVTAYIAAVFVALLAVGTGIYVWIKISGHTFPAALFGGVVSALSGPAIVHFTHMALLQGFSLMPWVIAATYYLAASPSPLSLALLAVSVSFQILAGSPQPAFITFLFVFAYYIFLIGTKKVRIRLVGLFLVAYMLAAGIAAAQLLPSWEFLRQTTSPRGSSSQATLYEFPLKHVITYFSPYLLGNPKNGTYFAQNNPEVSIFWENTGYIGIVPILFILIAAFIRGRKHLSRAAIFFGTAASISFLLMLGTNSPLYIIHTFWPFSLFHTPSRFIWILTLILVWMSAAAYDVITKRIKKRLILIVFLLLAITVQVGDSVHFWSSYHLTAPPEHIIEKAGKEENAPTIFGREDSYTLFLGFNQTYSALFSKGWKESEPYEDLARIPIPNVSAIDHIASFQAVTGRAIRRSSFAESILAPEIKLGDKTATISAIGSKLLTIFSIGTIVSTVPVDNATLEQEPHPQQRTIHIYRNLHALPRYYTASGYETASTLETAKRILENDDFTPGKTILLEQTPLTVSGQQDNAVITVKNENATQIHLAITGNERDTYLIRASAYYPGWNAAVDGKNSIVIPANINQQAVFLPKGTHDVVFEYHPQSLAVGMAISGISFAVVLSLMVFPLFVSHAGSHQRAFLPGRRRPHNRAR